MASRARWPYTLREITDAGVRVCFYLEDRRLAQQHEREANIVHIGNPGLHHDGPLHLTRMDQTLHLMWFSGGYSRTVSATGPRLVD